MCSNSKKSEIVCFELNNWFSGRDYPAEEPYVGWMCDDFNINFMNEEWVKENRLCVVFSVVDMSFNFCITATREWVENNCPSLLIKYTEFIRQPDKYGDVFGRFGNEFLEYTDDNIGITRGEDY